MKMRGDTSHMVGSVFDISNRFSKKIVFEDLILSEMNNDIDRQTFKKKMLGKSQFAKQADEESEEEKDQGRHDFK